MLVVLSLSQIYGWKLIQFSLCQENFAELRSKKKMVKNHDNQLESKRRCLTYILGVSGLCILSYILGAYQPRWRKNKIPLRLKITEHRRRRRDNKREKKKDENTYRPTEMLCLRQIETKNPSQPSVHRTGRSRVK